MSASTGWHQRMSTGWTKLSCDLGGGVIKQRIARAGEGASGGFRSIVLYRRGKLAMLALDDRQIANLTKTKALIEVICHG
jgi:hypothetical protein